LSKGRGMARCWSDIDMSAAIEEHVGVDSRKSLSEQHFSVEIVAGGGGFLKPLRQAGVVPRTPFEVRDGWVEWLIESSKENLKEMFRLFDAASIPYRLLSTRHNSNRLLTPRQLEVFEFALKKGYYDVPRKISLSELAEQLSVAKSTLSTQLQRIESGVMYAFKDDIRNQSP
jgi:predicted DNA binding protein